MRKFALIFLYILLFWIPLSSAYAVDYTALIETIDKGIPERQEEAKNKLFNELERVFNPINYRGVSEGKVLFANFIGNHENECVIITGLIYPSNTKVFIFKKENKQYELVSHFSVGIFENITTANLIEKKRVELVLDSKGQGTSWNYVAREIYKWDGERTRLIWRGVLKDIFYGGLGPKGENYDIQAEVNYIDTDKDEIKEIIREGEKKHFLFNELTKEWDKLVSSKKLRQVYKWNQKKFKYELLSEQ